MSSKIRCSVTRCHKEAWIAMRFRAREYIYLCENHIPEFKSSFVLAEKLGSIRVNALPTSNAKEFVALMDRIAK